MRNYIFRGKKVYGDGWAYGSLVKRGEYCCILEDADSDEIFMDAETGVIDGNLTPVRPETVGEYVGIGDVHGKPIFDGDVLLPPQKYVQVNLIVAFEDFSWKIKSPNKKYYEHRLEVTDNGKYKVIGNIHDNPELLEV